MGQTSAPSPGGGTGQTVADDGYGGKASGPQAPQMAPMNPFMRLLQGGIGGLGQGLQQYGGQQQQMQRRFGPGTGQQGSMGSMLPGGNNINFYGGY